MKLTTVKEIYKNREEYLNRVVTVGGWVRSVRGSKAFGFIVLHDGTFFETLQVVYHDNMPNFAENHDTFETENKHFPGGISCTFPLCIRDPQILPGKRFRICTHTADHRK